jgi:TonB family protein
MPEAWKQWVGQIVNSRFVLRQYLGGSPHSAVFLTERQNATFDKAAIKLIAADPDTKDFHLTRWHDVAQLSHPHLLRLFHYGQCKLDGLDLLYTVSEFADEDLGQILPSRPLNALETREVLLQIADALSYLHAGNFVHRRVHPGNIHAVGDDIKLSSDSICRSSESVSELLAPTVYDAPEIGAAAGRIRRSPTSDVYSLGTSIVEALTQRVPVVGTAPSRLPAPFDEIVDRAQHPDPELRWTAADIVNRLNSRTSVAKPVAEFAPPAPVTAGPTVKAANVSSPAGVGAVRAAVVAVETGEQPAPVHVASAEKPHEGIAGADIAPKRNQVTAESLSTYQVPHYVPPDQVPLSPVGPVVARRPRRIGALLPITAVAVILLGLLLVPKFIRRSTAPVESPATAQSAASSTTPSQAQQQASSPARSIKQSAQKKKGDTASISRQPEQPDPAHLQSPATTSSEQSAKSETTTPLTTGSARSDTGASGVEPAPAADRSSSHNSGIASADGVAQKFLPDVSQRALNTIRGTVRVGVRVEVGPSGVVQTAGLSNPSGSEFFNNAALQAAKRWQFQPDASANTRSWLVHFEFTPSTVRANAAPAS